MQVFSMAIGINELIDKIDGMVWGWPLIILILSAGIWLSVRTGFVQVSPLKK